MRHGAHSLSSLAAAFVMGSLLAAQPPSRVSLRVHVSDTLHEPITQAFVSVMPRSSGALGEHRYTNKHGDAAFHLAPGEYDVRVRFIGHSPQERPVRLGPIPSDTVQIVLQIDPLTAYRINEDRMLADGSQPRLTIQPGQAVSEHCDGVDSLRVDGGVVTVTGFRWSPVTPAGVFGFASRRGSLLLLDLFDERPEAIGMIVSCVRWRAIITRLPQGRLSLIVRHMADGVTRHLLTRLLDTRQPMAIALPEP